METMKENLSLLTNWFTRSSQIKSSTNKKPRKISKKTCESLECVRTIEIGTGAFGIVYLGFTTNEEPVAIKVKKDSINERKKKLAHVVKNLFESELDVLRQLKHPNIVKFIGAQYTGNRLESIVMEYLKGQGLDAKIYQAKSLDEDLIRIYTYQILNAIVYMHSIDIMHRDIKSSNIIIINNYLVKLIDFGMAKRAVDGIYSAQTDSVKSVVGTLPYMAPEIVDFESYDGRVDIWALGVLVYEMASGEPVFKATDGSTNMLANINTHAIGLNNLSPVANNFIQVCLIKSLQIRPTAKTLETHLFVQSQEF